MAIIKEEIIMLSLAYDNSQDFEERAWKIPETGIDRMRTRIKRQA